MIYTRRVDESQAVVAFVPFRRTSAVEQVFNALRDSIRSHALPIGSKLESEAALAGRFGVSRSVVREALSSCNAVGLTETRTGKGTFVVSETTTGDAKLGRYSAKEVQEVRPYIEIPAATLAASRRTDDQVHAMETLLDRMEAPIDREMWIALDAEFHLTIAEASGNRVFRSVVADLREAMANQSIILSLVPGRRDASDVEHREIVMAIGAGAPVAAGQAMKAHLHEVEITLSGLLTDRGTDSEDSDS